MIKLFEKKNCCFYCINFLENKSILYCNAMNSVLSRNFCLRNRCKKYVQKDKQTCSSCSAPMKRVIEWTGIAKGEGQGWCGNSKGNVI